MIVLLVSSIKYLKKEHQSYIISFRKCKRTLLKISWGQHNALIKPENLQWKKKEERKREKGKDKEKKGKEGKEKKEKKKIIGWYLHEQRCN